MKQLIGGILIAVFASLATLQIAQSDNDLDDAAIERLAEQLAANDKLRAQLRPSISYTDPSEQDAWVRGFSRGGEPRFGAENDEKPLADATNSVCFLTKVEIENHNDANDKTSCYLSIDEFTGWWQIHAEKSDGTDASVACNARCLVWE